MFWRSGGLDMAKNRPHPKTTARKGKTASSATKARSQESRSSSAGRSETSAARGKGVRNKPSTRRNERGPGGAGKEMGRAQHAAGRQRNAPKRGE
jgi:hypothetical protein